MDKRDLVGTVFTITKEMQSLIQFNINIAIFK